MNIENNIKIIKLSNGDDIVCNIPKSKDQLESKNVMLQLDRPFLIKYVPQMTPQGFKDYVALIKWTSYSKDKIVSIPKDKILTITTASNEMVSSYINISQDYDDQIKLKSSNYERQRLNDDENKKINELFEDFEDFEDEDTGTLH